MGSELNRPLKNPSSKSLNKQKNQSSIREALLIWQSSQIFQGQRENHWHGTTEESSVSQSASAVTQSCPTATPWTAARQASLSTTTDSQSLSKPCPLSRWGHPASSPSVAPFSSCPQPLPASRSFPVSLSSHEVAKVLEFQLQHQSFQWTPRTDLLQDRLAGSPCSPKEPQESSPIPQFKSINSLVLSVPHSPTFTPIHDHWKNHSLD